MAKHSKGHYLNILLRSVRIISKPHRMFKVHLKHGRCRSYTFRTCSHLLVFHFIPHSSKCLELFASKSHGSTLAQAPAKLHNSMASRWSQVASLPARFRCWRIRHITYTPTMVSMEALRARPLGNHIQIGEKKS